MKNLMKILSILILICGVIATASILMDPTSINANLYTFCVRMMGIFNANILFIASMAICCYCLERNDTNYILRIVPIYCMVPIITFSILTFFDLSDDALDLFTNVYSFFYSTQMWVLTISLILVIKPNNQISKIIHYIAYGAIIINVVLSLVVSAKTSMVERLPNVYGSNKYGGFNFSTVEETESLATVIYDVSVSIELFAVLLLFTTNYAFSDKVELEVDDIDFEALKEEADKLTKSQMTNKYPVKKKKVAAKQNDNPQDDQLDSVIPVSSGPVKNDTMSYAGTTVVASNNSNASKILTEGTGNPNVQVESTTAPPNKFLLDDDQNNQGNQSQGKFM